MTNLNLSFYTQKKPDAGEDSPPICERVQNYFLLGVFDGMGGAGSKPYIFDGQTHSGAYFASRIAREAALGFFESNALSAPDAAGDFIERLKIAIEQRLRASLEKMKYEPSLIKSSLIVTLPTTAVIINIFACKNKQTPAGKEWYALFIWAGDSRGYILDERRGLQQITKDDITTGDDALSSLRNDPTLSNRINLSEPFTLNARMLPVRGKGIYLAATDGCFGYWPSPMHFEWCLLETMQTANSTEEWQQLLRERIEERAADDASLSLYTVGWSDFGALKKSFENRLLVLREKYIGKIDSLPDDTVDKSKVIEELWQDYKTGYESHFVSADTGATESSPERPSRVSSENCGSPPEQTNQPPVSETKQAVPSPAPITTDTGEQEEPSRYGEFVSPHTETKKGGKIDVRV